jgi:cyclopropane-fatty-acyl-phospholipid synthase
MSDKIKNPDPLDEPAAGGDRFYHEYNLQEDTERLSYHYEQEPEFFLTFMGSKWHTYSCSLWEEDFSITEAEEKKLDKLARMMELKPGMHILDVGMGWGGPLVYLCEKYGVSGHGISISPKQVTTSEERAAKHNVNATFELTHWKNLPEVEMYDAILTDEVLVHLHDLGGFFEKCYKILKPDSIMVHKELHQTRTDIDPFGPAGKHVNKVFGYTGNYRPLYEELKLLDENNFSLKEIYQIPITHYIKTLDHWLDNMFENRAHLKKVASPDFYKDIRAYLKVARTIFSKLEYLGLHIVASRKIIP